MTGCGLCFASHCRADGVEGIPGENTRFNWLSRLMNRRKWSKKWAR